MQPWTLLYLLTSYCSDLKDVLHAIADNARPQVEEGSQQQEIHIDASKRGRWFHREVRKITLYLLLISPQLYSVELMGLQTQQGSVSTDSTSSLSTIATSTVTGLDGQWKQFCEMQCSYT